MKSSKLLALILSAAWVLPLAACGGGTSKEPPMPEDPPIEEPEKPIDTPTHAAGGVTLTASNSVNTAVAYFTAEYTEDGIVLYAEVTDPDIYTGVYYSYGYDDNVEYLINLASSAEGWDTAYTYHFLITADGDTFFQKAVTANGFGPSYSLDLLCSYGENITYSAERTETGYRTRVFLAYSLLNTDREEAYENLCVCPAMRNTHDYADSVWASYRGSGCDWARASTFLKVDAEGYVNGKGKGTDVLFLGDALLDPAGWLTYYDDTAQFSAVDLAVRGGTATYWREHFSEITAYDPGTVAVLIGADTDTAKETEAFLSELHAALPAAKVCFTERLPFTGTDTERMQTFNSHMRDFCGGTDYAVWVTLGTDGLTGLCSADGRGFNQQGYNLWMRALRGAAGLAGGTSAFFGDGAMFASSVCIGDADGVAVLDGTHDQYTYFKGAGGREFYARAAFTAETVYGGDLYPKFGLVAVSQEKSLFFYIDGSGSLTSRRVGYVLYEGNHTWNWSGSIEQSVEISYTGTDSCTLGLLRYGGYLFLTADGETVFTIADPFGTAAADAGVLSFNTRILLRDPMYATEDLANYLPV